MLSRLDLRGGDADPGRVLAGPAEDDDTDALASVRAIIADVRARGDAALRELTARFDGCVVDDLAVPPAEVAAALDAVPSGFRAALEYAAGEIRGVPRGAAGRGAPPGA